MRLETNTQCASTCLLLLTICVLAFWTAKNRGMPITMFHNSSHAAPGTLFNSTRVATCEVASFRQADPPDCLGRYNHPFSGCLTDSYESQVFQSIHQGREVSHLRCGFLSEASYSWLQSLHNNVSHCEYVVFTAAFSYGLVQDTSDVAKNLSGYCFVAFVDQTTMTGVCDNCTASQLAEHPRYSLWQFVVMDPFLLSTTITRSAHMLKSLGPRLFPKSKVSLYYDIKVSLPRDPSLLVKAVENHPHPLLVITQRHEIPGRDVFSEFLATIVHLRARRFGVPSTGPRDEKEAAYKAGITGRDFTDIFRQYVHLAEAGYPMFSTNMLDSCMLIWNHQNSCTTALGCLWHNEIAYYSMREQLNFLFVAQSLGLTEQIYHLAPDLAVQPGIFPPQGTNYDDAW